MMSIQARRLHLAEHEKSLHSVITKESQPTGGHHPVMGLIISQKIFPPVTPTPADPRASYRVTSPTRRYKTQT